MWPSARGAGWSPVYTCTHLLSRAALIREAISRADRIDEQHKGDRTAEVSTFLEQGVKTLLHRIT